MISGENRPTRSNVTSKEIEKESAASNLFKKDLYLQRFQNNEVVATAEEEEEEEERAVVAVVVVMRLN